MNIITYRRTKIYIKASVSDPYTMYFHQAMKENDATQFLKIVHKKFADLLGKGILKLILHHIVPDRETLFPAVWEMKQKQWVDMFQY